MTQSDLEAQWLREGFTVRPTHGGFLSSIAQIFCKPVGDDLVFRVVITSAHCNGFEIAHGGFISTLADSWLAYNVAHRLPKATRFVTANLSIDFLKPTRPGDWLESAIDRVKLGATLCHLSGALLADGQPVAAMRATFALLHTNASVVKK